MLLLQIWRRNEASKVDNQGLRYDILNVMYPYVAKPDKILCQPLRLAILELLRLNYDAANYSANLAANAIPIMCCLEGSTPSH
jgi:hypothetical protein